ncbi:MAG: hypothetical protein DRI36_04365 [Caldiserica bacterium]|nr:MAG: hypothetical protein DRI36_04365 [Caldisericota bacterium]
MRVLNSIILLFLLTTHLFSIHKKIDFSDGELNNLSFSGDSLILSYELNYQTVYSGKKWYSLGTGYFPENGCIYIFGGYEKIGRSTEETDKIYVFNPQDYTLTLKSTKFPSPISDVLVVYASKKFYIFGGSNSDKIYEYNPLNDSLIEKNSTLPEKLEDLAGCYVPYLDKIYLFGGVRDEGSSYETKDYIMEYDIKGDVLTVLSQRLPQKTSLKAVYYPENGMIYLLCGDSEYIMEYNPLTSEIKDFLTLPTKRYKGAVCYDKKRKIIFIFGGYHYDYAIYYYIGILGFLPEERKIITAGYTPYSLENHSVIYVSDKDRIYLIGGVKGLSYRTVEDIYEFSVNYKSEGEFISPVLSFTRSVYWRSFSANYSLPNNTEIIFYYKVKDNSWSEWKYSEPGEILLSSSAIQFKVILRTSDSFSTPVLSSLYLDYNTSPSPPYDVYPEEELQIKPGRPLFQWNSIDDLEGDSQYAFQIRLREKDKDYTQGYDSGIVYSSLNEWKAEDLNLEEGEYYWQIRVCDNSGYPNNWGEWSNEFYFRVSNYAPSGRFQTAYPNPYSLNSGRMRIKFTLSQSDRVKIEILDFRGCEVWKKSEIFDEGDNIVEWDGRDRNGREVESGVYILRIIGGDINVSKRIGVR